MGTTGRVEPSDEALLVRYGRGDVAAFDALVRRHQAAVYQFLLRHVRSAAAAEQLLEASFLALMERAGGYGRETRVVPALYKIARDLAAAHLRAVAKERDDSTEDEDRTITMVDDAPRSTPDGADAARVGRLLARAVDALPEEAREALLLRELSGLPFADVAAIIGEDLATTKGRVRAALERLAATLAEHEELARAMR